MSPSSQAPDLHPLPRYPTPELGSIEAKQGVPCAQPPSPSMLGPSPLRTYLGPQRMESCQSRPGPCPRPWLPTPRSIEARLGPGSREAEHHTPCPCLPTPWPGFHQAKERNTIEVPIPTTFQNFFGGSRQISSIRTSFNPKKVGPE